MASPASKTYDLDLAVASSKNLKNVNWSNGALRPYAGVWHYRQRHQRLHAPPDNNTGAIRTHPVRLQPTTTAAPAPSGTTALPSLLLPHSTFLSIDVLPFAPCKPLVASLRLPLLSFLPVVGASHARTFELRREKIRFQFTLRQRNHAFYVSFPAQALAGFAGGIAPT